MLCQTDDADVGQLRLFAVEKEYRCYGIGSALIEAFMNKAKEAGYKKIILWQQVHLQRRFDTMKLGFKAVDSVKNTAWNTDGDSLDEIKMELILV